MCVCECVRWDEREEDQLEAGSDVADGKLPHVTSGIDIIQTEVVDLQDINGGTL